MIIFIHGKKVRVERPPTTEGMDADDSIHLNADPIWLHCEGLWWEMELHADL